MSEHTKIDELSLDSLIPFKDHPFKVLENKELTVLAESIRESSVLVPAMARPRGGTSAN